MEYSGRILINTRNVPPIQKIINSPSPPSGYDLNRLLSFLSTYTLSKGLLYDSTIPEKHLVPALEAMDSLGIIKDSKPLKL